jgi:membrane associated rhomboid family serine protease
MPAQGEEGPSWPGTGSDGRPPVGAPSTAPGHGHGAWGEQPGGWGPPAELGNYPPGPSKDPPAGPGEQRPGEQRPGEQRPGEQGPPALPGGWGTPAWPGNDPPGWPGSLQPARVTQGEPALGPNTRCYEHPDRLAGAVCRNCGRPICSDCMVEAPVGWHCRRCVRQESRTTPVRRYQPGMAGLVRPGRSPVTTFLIVVNLVLFVAAAASPSFTVNSYEVPYYIQQGQWWRLFSSFFVTNDVLDIALNMFSLYVIGRLVEPALEKWRYLALYLLSGLGGGVATYLLARLGEASAGASGAIFGLVGAYFVLARRARLNTSGIVGLIVINLVFDFTYSGINWLAHLGGLATGAVVAAGYIVGGRQHRTVAAVVTVACTCAVLGLLMLLPPGHVALE